MGRHFQQYLTSKYHVYSCINCQTHLARHEDIISKAFQGRNGRAYLLKTVNNIDLGRKEDRNLLTGLHTVADIICNVCQETVGWKYMYAFEDAQRYKVGTFILEKNKVSKQSNFDDL